MSYASIAIAFTIGSLGSVIGGIMAFMLMSFSKHLYDIPVMKCASCVTAGYIGGTVNYYETAKTIGLHQSHPIVVNGIAGLDIGVMVLYFAVLSYIKSQNIFKSLWLTSLPKSYQDFDGADRSIIMNDITSSSRISLTHTEYIRQSLNALLAIVCAVSISSLASLFQHKSNIIGSSVAISISLSYFISSILSKLNLLTLEFRTLCGTLSEHFMQLFYTTIGLYSNFFSFVRNSYSSLSLMLILLCTHAITVFGGSFLWNKVVTHIQSKNDNNHHQSLPCIDLDTAMLAR